MPHFKLQSPYGAFLFATYYVDANRRRRPRGVAIPLRGFSFCDLDPDADEYQTTLYQLQSPYGAFLFATR